MNLNDRSVEWYKNGQDRGPAATPECFADEPV